MTAIALYQARDVARSRWLAAYALFFYVACSAAIATTASLLLKLLEASSTNLDRGLEM